MQGHNTLSLPCTQYHGLHRQEVHTLLSRGDSIRGGPSRCSLQNAFSSLHRLTDMVSTYFLLASLSHSTSFSTSFLNWGAFCVELACHLCLCMGFFCVLCFLPTVQICAVGEVTILLIIHMCVCCLRVSY